MNFADDTYSSNQAVGGPGGSGGSGGIGGKGTAGSYQACREDLAGPAGWAERPRGAGDYLAAGTITMTARPSKRIPPQEAPAVRVARRTRDGCDGSITAIFGGSGSILSNLGNLAAKGGPGGDGGPAGEAATVSAAAFLSVRVVSRS